MEEILPKLFIKNYRKMFTMEKVKYLPPKFSYAVKDLANHFD